MSSETKRRDGQTYDAWLTVVVNAILHKSGIYCINLNNRILSLFGSKISKLKLAYKQASRKGGRQVLKLVNAWKDSTFKISIHYEETDVGGLKKENLELTGEKRKLEDALEAESVKRAKVESDIKILTETTAKNKLKYKGKFKQLVKKIAKLQCNQKTRGPDKKKSFNEYTRQHQARVKKQLKDQCETVLSFLGQYEFAPSHIELCNLSTGETETFFFEENDAPSSQGSGEELKADDEQVNELNMWLYIKDKFSISNEAWHELAMKADNLYKLIKHAKDLNSKWDLKDTPGTADGVQISFKDSLLENIQRLRVSGLLENGKTIKIKISGDGTNIGKRLSVVNITYTILNEDKVAMSEKGNYLLAVIKAKESYETLAESLKDLIKEMELLTEITLDNITYPLEYFLGGDWKFLASVCGIGGANADYACIWCLCPKLKRYDISKVWSLLDPDCGARNLEQIKNYSKSRKFNCTHAPLFTFIPLNHVVIDTLHLYLRICDNLIQLLIRQLKVADAIDKKKTYSDNFAKEKYPHMARYEKYLQDMGINFNFYIAKDTKMLDYRDLTGPEKVKLFKQINISYLLPNNQHSHIIQDIWDEFSSTIMDLKQNMDFTEVPEFKSKVDHWMQKFLVVYQTKDVTPYMHALVSHVPEFLKLYGNIEFFTQQGMEKYNDITSKNYFRSTNHQGVSAIKQLFLKRKRAQHLEAAGCEREKRDYCCSNCHAVGHTIKTCMAECKHCKFATHCAHITKVNGKYYPLCQVDN